MHLPHPCLLQGELIGVVVQPLAVHRMSHAKQPGEVPACAMLKALQSLRRGLVLRLVLPSAQQGTRLQHNSWCGLRHQDRTSVATNPHTSKTATPAALEPEAAASHVVGQPSAADLTASAVSSLSDEADAASRASWPHIRRLWGSAQFDQSPSSRTARAAQKEFESSTCKHPIGRDTSRELFEGSEHGETQLLVIQAR